MATKGTVSGVIANMVTLVVDGPVAQNEICYISTGGDRLMAEVIKVVGTQVYVQVFESTRGLKVGAEAEFTGHMLEVTLGPGMLSKNYDGLQNDLDKMDGVFLKRGQYTYPLDKGSKWHFVPLAKVGDQVEAAAWLGQVDENFQPLKIMVPFEQKGVCTVKSIVEEGDYGIEDTIAVLTDEEGNDVKVNMIQKWPVKRAMTNYKEKPRPFKLLETGVRVIDTVNPIVEGGTGFIPGPFGTGKTVLQHAISKPAEADIVLGDLYLANLGVPVGSKQGGVRPVVVLQNDVGNYYAPTITIAPLTSKIEKKRKQPTHFFLRKAKGLAKPSMVLAEQLDTCDKICVIRYLGRVSKGQMRGIDEAVRIQLGYYIPEQAEKKRQGKCRKDGEEGDG